eukprot:4678511-Prymnesium_polylepis.1
MRSSSAILGLRGGSCSPYTRRPLAPSRWATNEPRGIPGNSSTYSVWRGVNKHKWARKGTVLSRCPNHSSLAKRTIPLSLHCEVRGALTTQQRRVFGDVADVVAWRVERAVPLADLLRRPLVEMRFKPLLCTAHRVESQPCKHVAPVLEPYALVAAQAQRVAAPRAQNQGSGEVDGPPVEPELESLDRTRLRTETEKRLC